MTILTVPSSNVQTYRYDPGFCLLPSMQICMASIIWKRASTATNRTVMMDDVEIPGQTFCPVRFSKFIINPIETGNQLRSVFSP